MTLSSEFLMVLTYMDSFGSKWETVWHTQRVRSHQLKKKIQYFSISNVNRKENVLQLRACRKSKGYK